MLFQSSGKVKYTGERKGMNKTRGLCAKQDREFVREPSFVRTLHFQQHRKREKREREKTKRAMLPSVSFIDDEDTSQQVFKCWKYSTREFCTERRFRRPRRTCDRSTFAKIVYERGEQGGRERNRGDE